MVFGTLSFASVDLTPGKYTIVAFGDSTTATRRTIDNVYADNLRNELPLAGITGSVINSGVGGSHTGTLADNQRHRRAHALQRYQTNVIAHNPDIIIMQFGINDSYLDKGTASVNDGVITGDPSRIPYDSTDPRKPGYPNNYEANLTSMVRKFKADLTDPIIVLMTPNQFGTSKERWRNDVLSVYAQRMRKVAAAEKILLVDIWKLFDDYDAVSGQSIDDLLLDGVHPNDAGHRLVADAIYDILGITIPETPKQINEDLKNTEQTIIKQRILPAHPVSPSAEIDYNPLRGQRYAVNSRHKIPADMVVQGDTVELTVVTDAPAENMSVQRQLKKKCGSPILKPDPANPLKVSFLADGYGENIVEAVINIGKKTSRLTTVINVEFSSGILVDNTHVVRMPPDARTNEFIRPFKNKLFGYREQVTALNPNTGRLVTTWQVKFASGDVAPMGIAVMHSDDFGITWQDKRYLFIQEPSNSGWGSICWNPAGNEGKGEFLIWGCSHVRIPENRLILWRSRDNGLTWQHVGDSQDSIVKEFGIEDTKLTYFGVNRTVATKQGTLVSPMVSRQYVRAIWSDDNGATWHNSNIDNSFPQGNEDAIVETIDGGKLILLARSRGPQRRFESIDGGKTWVAKSNCVLPTTAVNFGLDKIVEPGSPEHGYILHCAAVTRKGPHKGRQRLGVSVNTDAKDVAPDKWTTRLLLDYNANYSDILYIPHDKSIFASVETRHFGTMLKKTPGVAIRYFKMSYRYWKTLPIYPWAGEIQ
jgi:lysophospholipase L1-like esterase